ncbi:PEPxxWA-CTERM sorting domain-containing protein [Gimibacter soli]|uniref:PEPxxWA-CTERM sorting domain-containing protein n=1 Tax=Gimibacter soli TaxID=3024400 RepID=A0AAE9XSG5_9PROT|nr:PEPxxWA-CTERM sorting domain-containing protein [Gimibacter soli]WCL54190.1 PEPxxWA-CTERM sorting domain-containing protein [Gimibacter soli]
MAVALAFVMGGAGAASAATQTFVFSGTATFATEAVANAFGYEFTEIGVFNFTMRFDDSIAPSTQYSSFGGRTTSKYAIESLSWKVGEVEWSRPIDPVSDNFRINDYTQDIGNKDGILIYSGQKSLGGGILVYNTLIAGRDSSFNNYSITDLSMFDLWDSLSNEYSYVSTNIGQIKLDNIGLAMSQTGDGSDVGALPAPAVPEPATWMMMIMGFSLAGLTARRRLVHA